VKINGLSQDGAGGAAAFSWDGAGAWSGDGGRGAAEIVVPQIAPPPALARDAGLVADLLQRGAEVTPAVPPVPRFRSSLVSIAR
jgi:hypothetical protein